LQAIGDARLEIADALGAEREQESAPTSVGRQRSFLPVGAAAAVTAVVVAAATWALKPAVSDSDVRVTRSLIETNAFEHRPPGKPGEARGLIRPDRTAVALSPDGRTLVFRGIATDVNPGGGTQSVLFVRSLDSLTATPIATTTGAESPFFSPDGAWIAYWDAGELRRVPVAGSPTYTTIARVPGEGAARIFGGSWGDDGVILFSTAGDLWRVPASGGSPERVLQHREDEFSLKLPHMLPGGKTVLFTRQRSAFRWDDAQIVARSLVSGEQKVVLDDAVDARYVSSGHIVFMRRGKLMAVPFDSQRLTVLGGTVTLVDDVMQAANMTNTNADSGAGQFAISPGGVLVYVTGGVRPDDERDLVWVSRDGVATAIPAPKREYITARLSPDGQKIVAFTGASVTEGGDRVWVYDIGRSTLTPLTTQQERAAWGMFSPDGARIAFQSVLAGRSLLVWKAADGTGNSEQLDPVAQQVQTPSSWSNDDKIAFVQTGDNTRNDVWVLDARTRKAAPVIQTAANETAPALSADGKWLAYTSNESGRDEVYVQPYPGPGLRVPVSNGGGHSPAWTADGRELFYASPIETGFRLMAVAVTPTGTALSAGVPRTLFEGRYGSTTPARGYDVTSDGRRFVMTRLVEPPPPPPSQMVLVQNFGEELKRRVPAGGTK
jgi:serine/threonine-protein kinase